MFTRTSTLTRGLRCYSSGPSQNGALFLSDLMQRIDTINARTMKLNDTKTEAQKAQKSQKQTQKQAPRTPKQQKGVRAKAPVHEGTRIAVKDHPLSRNTFKLMDESNFKPRTAKNPESRNAGARQRQTPQTKTAAPRKKPQVARKRAATPKTPVDGPIVSKELVAGSLKPSISGETFFYGKPTTLTTCTTSRVAAVAKETLLESKYPYKLPKSIIDKLDGSFTGNKFLLQKDYTLEVDVAKFGDRIRKVVKGEVDQVDLGKKPVASSVFTAAQLMQNGDLDMAQKQTIYDVASGLKSAKLLVENAAWNK